MDCWCWLFKKKKNPTWFPKVF